MKSFFSLLYYHLRAALFHLWIAFKEIILYWKNFAFLKIDLLFFFYYLKKGPYRIAKEHHNFVYGETPLTIYDKISKAVHLDRNDLFLDLGSGRSKGLFWLSSFVGCHTVGCEIIPPFIEKALAIKRAAKAHRVTLLEESFYETALEKATVIYLYGITLSDDELERLVERFRPLKPGTKVVTVSFKLSDVTKEMPYRLMKTISGSFAWGRAEIYIQERQ